MGKDIDIIDAWVLENINFDVRFHKKKKIMILKNYGCWPL